MIAMIRGKLIDVSFTEALVDVNGVGYRIFIPMSTFDKLPQPGNEVTVLTYTNVREDAIHLYGFATQEEKKLFETLIGVSGVGAKVALNILSNSPVSTFCQAISDSDINVIKSINGIGKKTAERLIIELRDKVAKLAPTLTPTSPSDHSQAAEDALLALEQLGFKRDKAHKAIYKLIAELPEDECSSENLIRKTLQNLNK
jgi:holliday junction DNA helicase RuvA